MLFSISKNINSKHLIVFAAFCFYIYNFSLGLELTPDSFSYLSGAKNILQGNGYIGDCNQRAISIFPPFYSFYLIPFLKFGEFSSNGIIISSILLYTISILLLVYFKKINLNSWTEVLIFIITISFLFKYQHHLLSEVLFIPLFILWYTLNESYKNKTNLIYFGILGLEILLISTRYSAILFIAAYYIIELFFDSNKKGKQKFEKIYLVKYLIPIFSFSYFFLLQGAISNWEFLHIANIVNHVNTGYSIIDYLYQIILDFGDNIYGKALSFQLEKYGLLLAFTLIFISSLFFSFNIQIEKKIIYFIIFLLLVSIIILFRGGAGDPLRGRFLFWIYIILLFNVKVSLKPNSLAAKCLIYFLLLSHIMNDSYFLVKAINRSKKLSYSGILLPHIKVNSNPTQSKFTSAPNFKIIKDEIMLVYPCYKWQL